VRKFNPKYDEGPGALVGDLRRLHADIAGNRDFLAYLRNTKTFYDKGAGRELNLILIDYEDPENNVFEVTEEFYCHNGKHGTREDVVFLINGIPILVIECKNATKDEAIALGVDQVRRYHTETPELFVPQMVFTATEAIGFSYGGPFCLGSDPGNISTIFGIAPERRCHHGVDDSYGPHPSSCRRIRCHPGGRLAGPARHCDPGVQQRS
jgi:hypothetical protein